MEVEFGGHFKMSCKAKFGMPPILKMSAFILNKIDVFACIYRFC